MRARGTQPGNGAAGHGRQGRDLPRELLGAQEEERRRLAADLHDEVIQPLVAGLLQLDVLDERLAQLSEPTRAPLAEVARRVRQDIEDGLRRARGFLVALRPPLLDSDGLAAAIAQELQRLAERSSARTTLDWQLEPVDADLETVVFRVVQEGLANVAKHARAATVRVAARRDGAALLVEVSDDGVGFDPEGVLGRAAAAGHLGLRLASERVEAVGGRLELDAAPGRGTTMRLRLPLPPPG
jgi:signal transduction histidine kinase